VCVCAIESEREREKETDDGEKEKDGGEREIMVRERKREMMEGERKREMMEREREEESKLREPLNLCQVSLGSISKKAAKFLFGGVTVLIGQLQKKKNLSFFPFRLRLQR
jgi:hypothetical protein